MRNIKRENRKIVFIDMDGVLANFDKAIDEMGSIEVMYKPNFFRGLEPMESGLDETVKGIERQGYTVKILSKACVPKHDLRFIGQMADKVNWLKEHLPSLDELNIIIQGSDESKGSIIDMYKDHDCILIDDYSKNLAEWSMAGGKGIKKAKRIKNGRPWKQVLNLSELEMEGVE